MDTINNIELRNELVYPSKDVLKTILGGSFVAFTHLLSLYDENKIEYEWKYYKDGKAWLCKAKKGKKTVSWMSAWKGYMQATIYFPERQVMDILAIEIKEETRSKIINTKNVGKSKPCIFEIRSKEDLDDFEKIMKYKLNTK